MQRWQRLSDRITFLAVGLVSEPALTRAERCGVALPQLDVVHGAYVRTAPEDWHTALITRQLELDYM